MINTTILIFKYIQPAHARSLIPMHLFPEFHNNSKLVQAGEIYLTLQFDNFPNHKFTHSFVLTDIANPILGLDFLHQNHVIIDTSSFNISVKEQQHSQQLVTSLPDVNLTEMSLHNLLNIYPDLVSGVLRG